MNLSETNELFGKLKIDEETKVALLKIIDKKTENDMKEVITEIRAQNNKINIVLWVVSIAMGIIVLLFSLKK